MKLTHLAYKRDGTLYGEPTRGILNYQHEQMEGPYLAEFALQEGEGGVDKQGLKVWFDTRLMSEFATIFEGREVWRGLVWEMTLEVGGEVRIKSMENMANAVKCRYVNGSGDTVHTSWYTHEESINQYGVKERIVTLGNAKPKDDGLYEEAIERAEVELQYSASPYTTAIAYRETATPRLSVTCVGRQVVANNVQLIANSELRAIAGEEPEENSDIYDLWSVDYGDDITVSDEIRRILAVIEYSAEANGARPWLYKLSVADNDTITAAGVSSNIGAFDRLLELSQLRNSDGEFYQLIVQNDGGVIYQKFDETPAYLRYPEPRGLRIPGNVIPTWEAKPGVIKYVDTSSGPALPDTWLSDRRLSFYERVVMRDGDDMATFHGRDLDAMDIYRAQEANQRWIESNKPPPAPPVQQPKKEPEPETDIYGHNKPSSNGL